MTSRSKTRPLAGRGALPAANPSAVLLRPELKKSARVLLGQLLIASALALALLTPRSAAAWVERHIESSTTSIELLTDGSAIVRHELSIEVQGGPLRGFELQGVDIDAEPLGDATVTRMQGALASSLPQPIQVQSNAGQLNVLVPQRLGFRGKNFLLKFGYRTRLLERGLIVHLPDGEHSELAWAGPRFEDGVDSVTLIVRAPAATHPPENAAESESDGDFAANFGIVMSSLRRSQAGDELELVRAHVARREAILWRVSLDRRLFSADAAPAPSANLEPAAPIPNRQATLPHAPPAPLPPRLFWVVLAGLGYALLIQLKSVCVARAALLRNSQPRTWLGWRAPYRAVAAGVCVGAAVGGVLFGDAPGLAAVALILAMAFATERPPQPGSSLRGPGQWQTLDALAFEPVPVPALPGAWLDAGRIQGFGMLVGALSLTTWLAARSFETSPYYGACVLLGSSALLPLFCTGRAAQLPPDALAQSRRFLSRVQRRLGKDPNLLIRPIGRFAAADVGLDELRLSVSPARGLPGLIGLELGLEFQELFGGWCTSPVVIVRTAEGSACHRALPRGLTWTRGRSADERASLVRPKLPTCAQAAALIQELLGAMQAPAPAEPARSARSAPVSKKSSKSSGKSLSTAKAGTRSSPAHAT
jgi:hypothetical protein